MQKYLNDIQETSLIDISDHINYDIFLFRIREKNNIEQMNITNLNMIIEDVTPLNNFYSNEDKKIIKLIISLDVPSITKFNEDLKILIQVKQTEIRSRWYCLIFSILKILN